MLTPRSHRLLILALAGLLSISTACDSLSEIYIQTADNPAQEMENSLATQGLDNNVFWTLYATVMDEDIYARQNPNPNS